MAAERWVAMASVLPEILGSNGILEALNSFECGLQALGPLGIDDRYLTSNRIEKWRCQHLYGQR